MFSIVEGKFHSGDKGGPFFWVVPTDDTKVGVDFLIETFSLTVGLGVIRGATLEVDTEEFADLFERFRGELRTAVRDNVVRKAETPVNVVDVGVSGVDAVHFSSTRDQNYPLTRSMVDHGHDRIITVRIGKSGVKIHRDHPKRALRSRF